MQGKGVSLLSQGCMWKMGEDLVSNSVEMMVPLEVGLHADPFLSS